MKKFLKSNIKLKISMGFMLAFLAFIVVQIISNKSIKDLENSFQRISDSRQLTQTIGTVSGSIKTYNNNISKFVFSGDDKFLNGNEESLSEINTNLQTIKERALDGDQKELIAKLDSLVTEEIKFGQRCLITFEKENRKKAIDLINTNKGEALTAEITDISKEFRQGEETNLIKIVRENKTYSDNLTRMDYAATLFSFIVILISISIFFRDISKRNKIERQLRIAQERAEQSAIMKEQFMANMSHEIRTPMNAIIGFANMLNKSKLDEKQKKEVSAIQVSGENLLNIINDILDFSKIEAGMMNIEKVSFNLSDLLHSINIMFLPKANEKNLKLDFYTSGKIPSIVIGDPTRITQILINLINNAIKFTNEGSISVKTELMEEENDECRIQFIVKDTGIGISKDNLGHIFERFTQANADTSRKYGGTGLGLSITKKLIELQKGNIKVESAEGVGSTFTFFIPYKKTTEAPRKPISTSSGTPLNSEIRILVAEDNTLNQYLIQSLLAEWGFDFEIVASGKLTVERLKEGIRFDLILLDIQMPDLNGYETARYIRDKLNVSIPIIAMTAHALPGEREKCLSYGMTDYISKPIRENELYELMLKYISKKVVDDSLNNKSQEKAKATKGIVNLDYVKELSNGNNQFVHQMIDLFIEESPKEITLLEEAIARKDMAAIKSISHKMNSTIPFVGLHLVIGNQVNTIEKLAEVEMDLAQIEKLFCEVKDVCSRAVSELETLHT